jgi:hypothetical protein
MGRWDGGGWNMVLVGNTNPPSAHCGTSGGSPFTIVENTPSIAEKPYIIKTDSGYSLMVPKLEQNKKGTTPNWENAYEVPFSQIYVASDTDSAATINSKLDQGLHIVLQPGIYNLEDSLYVKNHDTIIFGMGMATLIPTTGKQAIVVGKLEGVKIAGIIL